MSNRKQARLPPASDDALPDRSEGSSAARASRPKPVRDHGISSIDPAPRPDPDPRCDPARPSDHSIKTPPPTLPRPRRRRPVSMLGSVSALSETVPLPPTSPPPRLPRSESRPPSRTVIPTSTPQAHEHVDGGHAHVHRCKAETAPQTCYTAEELQRAEGGGRPRTNKPPPTKPKPSRRLPLQETDDVGSLTQNAPNSPSTSGRPVARSQTELHQIPTAGAATLRSRGLTSATPGLHCMPPPTLTPHSEVGQRHRTAPSAGHAEAARSPSAPGAHEASNPTPSTDRQPATANSSYLQSIRPSIGLLISALAVEIYDHPDHIGNITKLESLRMRLAIDQEEWERIFTEARELSGGGQASLYVEIVKQTATAWKDKTQGLNVSDAELRAALIKHFIDSGLQGVVARITPELIPDSLHGVAYKVSDIMRKDLRAPNRDSGRAAGDSGIGNSV